MIKTLVITASAILLSTHYVPAKEIPLLVWNPPERYDFQPKTRMTIRRIPQHLMQVACNMLYDAAELDLRAEPDQWGCAVWWNIDNSCDVFIIDEPYHVEGVIVTPENALRHERGHCNKWPSDHPED